MKTTATMLGLLLALMCADAVSQPRVEITTPFNVNQPPRAMPAAVRVAADGSLEMVLSGADQVRVFFKDNRTPVINRYSGRLVYEVILNAGMSQVLDIVDRCDDYGCEYRYGVRDLSDPRRPVLDPIIIIEP